jgi:hypothetical protein
VFKRAVKMPVSQDVQYEHDSHSPFAAIGRKRMVGVSFVITSGNRAAAAFDVKDCPEIKRRPRRDARRAKENPGVWDWKLRNKDHAAPITDKITI